MIEQKRTTARPSDWSWFDPCDPERFTAKALVVQKDAPTEIQLQNIVRLVDRIFDHLSVFEQFYAEANKARAGRHAVADRAKRLDIPGVKVGLDNVEQELWNIYSTLRDRRASFIQQQLESLGIDEHTKGLKVHIGSAGYLIEDWLNIDAGGADLTLNVNWGLQLPDGSAQFVYCSHLLEHLRYSDQAPVFVREIHRILAEDGTVRLVVPDLRKLLVAYAERNKEFFETRQRFYALNKGFMDEGIATLDYILLFAGAAPQVLSYNHKFGYDIHTLRKLLLDAGFSTVVESSFQASAHEELRVDAFSYNTQAQYRGSEHYSLFVEATK